MAGKGVFVDSAWAKERNLKTGDHLTLTLTSGRRKEFEIAATAKTILMGADQMELATVYMSRANLIKYFPGRHAINPELTAQPQLQFFPMIMVAPGADRTAVERQVERLLKSSPSLKVVSAKYIRERLRSSKEVPTAFLYLIFGIALVIGLLGVINTIAIGVHERRREIGFIRAVGANRRQIKQLVVGETLLLAVLGTISGTLLGAAVAAVFVKVLGAGQIAFPFVFPWDTALIVFAATVVLAFAAAVYPARLAGRVSLTAALRYE